MSLETADSPAVSTIPLLCVECDTAVRDDDTLLSHILTAHLEWTPYRCAFCPLLQIASFDALTQHHDAYHHGEAMDREWRPGHKERELRELMERSRVYSNIVHRTSRNLLNYTASDRTRPEAILSTCNNPFCYEPLETRADLTRMETICDDTMSESDQENQLTTAEEDNESVSTAIETSAHFEKEAQRPNLKRRSLPLALKGRRRKSRLFGIGKLSGNAQQTNDDEHGIKHARCAVCAYVPTLSSNLRIHHYGHMRRDFLVYRFVCTTDDCNYASVFNAGALNHSQRYPDHTVEDRGENVQQAIQLLLINRSKEQYEAEVEKAAHTGVAFGLDLSSLSVEKFWLKTDGCESLKRPSESIDDLATKHKPKSKSRTRRFTIHSLTHVSSRQTRAKRDTTCNICGYVQKSPGLHYSRMRHNHQFAHIARDFKIFRFECKADDCSYMCNTSRSADVHRRRNDANHQMEDRKDLLESLCRIFIDDRSKAEYAAEVLKATETGMAFGVDLTPLSSEQFWLREEDEPPAKQKRADADEALESAQVGTVHDRNIWDSFMI